MGREKPQVITASRFLTITAEKGSDTEVLWQQGTLSRTWRGEIMELMTSSQKILLRKRREMDFLYYERYLDIENTLFLKLLLCHLSDKEVSTDL